MIRKVSFRMRGRFSGLRCHRFTVVRGRFLGSGRRFTVACSLLTTFCRLFVVAAFITILPVSCRKKDGLTIVSWNVQTFFDAVTDGHEYSEFITNKKWGREMYTARLKKLCSVIKQCDADIFVMQELENNAQLFDIFNFLAGEWNSSKVYRWSCFAKRPGTSIGCGVLSRLPLSGLKVHGLDVRTEGRQPGLRPLIEVTVTDAEKEFVLFVNHWKSKSGGAVQSEVWRNREESILAKKMCAAYAAGKRVIACGDFNRDINDFDLDKNKKVRLRFFKRDCIINGCFTVTSPWFNDGILVKPGSYFFKDEWSRIDNFFIDENTHVKKFEPLTGGSWCSAETHIPQKFALYKGSGWSDHLPVKLTVEW